MPRGRRGKMRARRASSDDENEDETQRLDSESQSQAPSQSQSRSARNESGEDDETDSNAEEFSLDFTQPDYSTRRAAATEDQDVEMIDADDEEATAATPPRRTKSPSIPSKVAQMSAKAVDDLTAQLVRYLLYKASLKLPIKFGDISKDVYPKYKNVSRYFFKKATEQLEAVFGYRVVQVDENAAKEVYIVVNGETSQEHLLQLNKEGHRAAHGFLMMVLGLLWCAPSRRLSEDDLWKQLALVDASIKPNKEHKQLGDVTQLMKTLETQMYLATVFELDPDLKKIRFYAYGPRTELEIGNLQILNFVCKLITGRPPTEAQIAEINAESAPVPT